MKRVEKSSLSYDAPTHFSDFHSSQGHNNCSKLKQYMYKQTINAMILPKKPLANVYRPHCTVQAALQKLHFNRCTYLFHQQNGSITQNVDSKGLPISTNLVIKRDRNNKWNDKSAPSISTNLLIYQMGQPSRL